MASGFNSTLRLASKLLVVALAAALTVHCSNKKSKSSPAVITVAPETPVVIDVDLPDDNPPLKGAWFKFDVTLDNKTDYPLEIIGLEAEVTGMDASGGFTTKKEVWVPSSDNFSLDTLVCIYSSYGVWAAGEKKRLQIYDEFNAGCPAGIRRFTSEGNPSGPNGKNFRYKVKLKPLGYFIDSQGNAEDRFDKFKLFYTQ